MLLDTSVLIYLRDVPGALDKYVATLARPPALSIITRVELEGGAAASDAVGRRRRKLLEELLVDFPILNFDEACVLSFREIVRHLGYSRRKTLDRMIAATALAHDLSLATLNGPDFADIPGLELEIWSTA